MVQVPLDVTCSTTTQNTGNGRKNIWGSRLVPVLDPSPSRYWLANVLHCFLLSRPGEPHPCAACRRWPQRPVSLCDLHHAGWGAPLWPALGDRPPPERWVRLTLGTHTSGGGGVWVQLSWLLLQLHRFLCFASCYLAWWHSVAKANVLLLCNSSDMRTWLEIVIDIVK